MGYACPVCETPQRDGEHLAHHLAFTAMLHGDDHEAWLDEHVPDWNGRDPAGLAVEVTPHAADAEYHEVFEDTVDRGRPDVDVDAHGGAESGGHGHEHTGHAGRDHAAAGGPGAVDPTDRTDPEVADAIREAREMTREAGDETNDTGVSDDADDADDAADANAADDPTA